MKIVIINGSARKGNTLTRQRADTSSKVPGIKQKDAKVALCVAVVLKLGGTVL